MVSKNNYLKDIIYYSKDLSEFKKLENLEGIW